MLDAIKFQYTIGLCSGRALFDRQGIYVPGKLLLICDLNEFDDPYLGKKADQAYEKFRREHKGRTKNIEVPDSILEWAKAQHLANNPPKDLVDTIHRLYRCGGATKF